jgi:HK97 family phage prohead protease
MAAETDPPFGSTYAIPPPEWSRRVTDELFAERFNKMHAPAGSAAGGQFAPASGSSSGGGKSGKAAKGAHHRPTPSNQHPVGQGETGKRVSDLQSRLNALGAKPPLKVDGIFGPKTLAAVKAFQRSHGLKVDGLVGPKTTAALRTRTTAKAPVKAPVKAKAAAHAPAKAPAKAPVKTAPVAAAKPVPPRGTEPEGDDRGSDLKYGHGSKLWKYWTAGEGFAKWSAAVHKWTTLRDLLLKAGVPPQMADGLTTNIITAVMPGYMKQAHAQEKNMTHFAPDLDVVRSGGGMKLQPAEDGSLGTLTGRFSEFGRWYRVSSKMEGDFLERVAPGATADTIRDNKDSMRVLFDHGMDAQIGNKVLGPIASLVERSDGPHYEVPLFDTSYNRDLLPGLKAGVYGASMRMRVTGDEWDDKPARSDYNPDGLPERTITAMKVPEFGPVTFPANPGASAGVRSGTDDFYHRLRQADAPAFEDAMRAAALPLPEDFTGRDGARSAPGGEEDDASQANGGTSPTANLNAAQRDREWRLRRTLNA